MVTTVRALETYFQPPGPPTRPSVSLYDDKGNLFLELKAGIGTYPRTTGIVARAETAGKKYYPPADAPQTFGDVGASVAIGEPINGTLPFYILGYDNISFPEGN
eukprot:Phypoly_transcript_25364.p1 GENE.Phypoly_transcript_25364~~Phypoly_transcript_25364.p1  ORF type:complete len:104 (+),score=5.69 Phypoly_transcript_25364:164-475(+)